MSKIKKAESTYWVPVKDLNVDLSYQRTQQAGSLAKFKEWDENAAHAIVVSRRDDGTLWVIDGGHRAKGAEMRGIGWLLARVIDGLTIDEEAALFRKLSNNTGVSRFTKHNGLVVEGDEIALAIDAVLDNHGITLTKTSTGAPMTTGAIATLEHIAVVLGIDNLNRTLVVALAAWGGIGKSLRSEVLSGISRFIRAAGKKCDDERLAKKLQAVTHQHVIAKAAALKGAFGGRHSLSMALAISNEYNKGLSPEKKILVSEIEAARG